MPLSDLDVVRAVWATIDRDAGTEWPPPDGDFDRRMRTDLFHEDVVIRNAEEWPLADEYRGHDGLRRWASDAWDAFSEVRNEVEELIEVDDHTIVSVQKTRARMRHTGLDTKLRWATVWTLQDGKVLRAAGFATKGQALEAAQRASSSS